MVSMKKNMSSGFNVLYRIIGVVLLLLLVVFSLKFMNNKKEKFTDKEVEVHYYYMPGCRYCKQFDPEWTKFEKSCKNKNIKAYKKDGTSKEYETEVSERSVSGFPTIIVSVNGEDSVYEGERTEKNLLEYIDRI